MNMLNYFLFKYIKKFRKLKVRKIPFITSCKLKMKQGRPAMHLLSLRSC